VYYLEGKSKVCVVNKTGWNTPDCATWVSISDVGNVNFERNNIHLANMFFNIKDPDMNMCHNNVDGVDYYWIKQNVIVPNGSLIPDQALQHSDEWEELRTKRPIGTYVSYSNVNGGFYTSYVNGKLEVSLITSMQYEAKFVEGVQNRILDVIEKDTGIIYNLGAGL
jgi:hypothetical protein